MPQAMLLRMIEAHGSAKMSEVAALLSVKPPRPLLPSMRSSEKATSCGPSTRRTVVSRW